MVIGILLNKFPFFRLLIHSTKPRIDNGAPNERYILHSEHSIYNQAVKKIGRKRKGEGETCFYSVVQPIYYSVCLLIVYAKGIKNKFDIKKQSCYFIKIKTYKIFLKIVRVEL